MKILIYGFKPFEEHKTNISALVVKRLKLRKEFKVKKVILPVVLKKDILKKIKKFKPDIIIGLGLKNRGRLLEIERTARNIYKVRSKYRETRAKRIISSPRRPSRYFLNLKLKDKPKGVRADYFSGDYLCNFTQYIIMDFIKKNKLKTKFAFIHIPKGYNLQKATRIIQKIISEIKN